MQDCGCCVAAAVAQPQNNLNPKPDTLNMKTKTSLVLLLFAAFGLNAPAAIALFTSNFEGNTGAHVFSGDTDNTSGSSTLTINDWTTHTSLTSISGLTAISTTSGGFAQTQGGSGAYANANTVYISRNHNLDTNPQRGFSLSFTLNSPWLLDELTVLTRHTNNQGTQAQVGSTDLVINLSGGTLPAAVSRVTLSSMSEAPSIWRVKPERRRMTAASCAIVS